MSNTNNQYTEETLCLIDIKCLLPQEEPFIAIDRLIKFTENSATTETSIKPESLFVEKEEMTACGMLENIAQTCAAHIGYYDRYIANSEIENGVIAAVRRFDINRLPRMGEIITTEIQITANVFGMRLAEASIKAGEEILANSEIKIATKQE